ncbi:MAG: S41 family peptidase [Chitinophagaceae bacterium]|nr:S41 family peptidase [Chitinophagaceae bacterium]
MKTFALPLLLLVVSLIVNGQDKSEYKKSYAPKELQEDFLIFRKALETTYPSLYRFTDSLNFRKYLDDQFNSLDKPMKELEFYKVIALACSRSHDEHLIPTPSKNYYQYLQKVTHYFPFSLKIIDRRLYVLKKANTDNALPIGSEILSINGHSAEEILNRLLPAIPSDGYIESFNIRHLEDYSMTQNGNLFDLNYPIFFEDTTSFKIEFIHPRIKSEKKITIVFGIDYKLYKEFYWQRIGYKAPLEFNYLKSNIGYLRISSFLKWHRNDFKQDFDSLYDSIFTQLNQRNTKNLILDLRNNEGGDNTGEKLITYLLTNPYKHYVFTEEKFIGYPPVVDYLENGKDLFFIDSVVYRTSAGMYRLKKEYTDKEPLFNEQNPNKNNYKGKLYVLINGASGSMASVVATFLKGYNRAIFIGEESGGTMEGNTSNEYAILQLPNTKIHIEIPLIKKGNNVDFIKGRGVFADYLVTPKIEDITKGIDTELRFALELITSQK